MTPVEAVGPTQINKVDDRLVTVIYPAGSTTILSMQPTGEIETRPSGTQGPYELAILKSDRLIWAPLGAAGPVFVIPYVADIPNR